MNRSAMEEEIAVLEAMSKRGESYANDHGGHGWRNPIRSDTGPLLASLIAQHDAHRILEVGTAHGLSALYLVMGWEDIDGRSLETIEFDAAVAAEAQSRFKALGVPVTVHEGEAMEVITQRLSGRFDAVFLDAQKSHYGMQWRALTELGLVGEGTLLMADNVIDRKEECTELFEVLQSQGVDYRIEPTECGLLVATV